MDKPVFPDYSNSIVNFSCSILKHFGVPVRHNTLPAADAVLAENYKHVAVLLLDGLGINILEKHLAPDAFLRSNLLTAYSSVFPPTTTASTTSMLSGLTPIEHGWLGWDVYFRQIDKTVTCFFGTVADTKEPAAPFSAAHKYLPYKEIHQQIIEANARVPGDGSVVPPGSVSADLVFPFGPEPFPKIDDWFAEIKRQATQNTRTFTYAYWENPDHDLHYTGTDSPVVHKTVLDLNARIEKLCSELTDTVVFVTADHDHIDVENECYETDFPEFAKMFIRQPSIEPRGTSFFIKPEYMKPAGSPRKEDCADSPEKADSASSSGKTDPAPGHETVFAREFERLFGDDYVLFTRDEVYEKQIFGTGEPNAELTGIGDYVAVAVGHRTLYPTKFMYGKNFKSHHAGMTADEMIIPLICAVCQRPC